MKYFSARLFHCVWRTLEFLNRAWVVYKGKIGRVGRLLIYHGGVWLEWIERYIRHLDLKFQNSTDRSLVRQD